MFPAASLPFTLLLALSIVATPVEVRTPRITLPFAKRVNSSGGAINLVAHDQARAAALKERAAAIESGELHRRSGSFSFPVTNEGVDYVAEVNVGNPSTAYYLIIDIGSSNTWIGAGTPYTPTSTSTNTGEPVSVTYGSGSFSGEEWTDLVTLSSNLAISGQSIGVASSSSGFSGVDGILGLGPEGLTQGTLTNEPNTLIPTITQSLYSQGTISEEAVGVFFAPTNTIPNANGELTFGGADSSKYTPPLNYTPLTSTSPSSLYWGIEESITYGGVTILAETSGIVDTGTVLILIASDAYSAYQQATGGSYDTSTGLLVFTPSQYNALKDLNFIIGSVTYSLVPNGQIWPRTLNTYVGGTSGLIYGIVASLGTPSGQGLDFVDGMAFLERFYSVYDTTHSQVGFATTAYTYSTTN